jgi:membrane associated rhomboid family serine protease
MIVNVLLSFRPGISFGGHLGGLVAGVMCGFVMMAPAHKRPAEVWTYVTPIVVGVASVAVSVAIAY